MVKFAYENSIEILAFSDLNFFRFSRKNSKIWHACGDDMSSEIPLKYQALMSRVSNKNNNSKAEAIKAFCLQCVDYKFKRVRYCSASHCALFHVRPYQSKIE